MSAVKEPAHFLLKENYELGAPLFEPKWWDVDSYEALFEPGKLCGEASIGYSQLPFTPGVARRIFSYNPDAKFIYIVRNPLDRLVSHYNFSVRHWPDWPPLKNAVIQKPAYLSISDYATNLGCYLDRFPKENVLVLISERFRNDLRAGTQSLEAFLGIKPIEIRTKLESNVTPDGLRPPRLTSRALDQLRRRKYWKTARGLVPKSFETPAKALLYKRAVQPAGRADVPEAVVEYLSVLAQRFRHLIKDPIPEWDI